MIVNGLISLCIVNWIESELHVLVLVLYRQQVWPNQTGPSYIVSPGKWRRWMTRCSTPPTPSSSPRPRIESGQSWCVICLFNIVFNKSMGLIWALQMYSLPGSDGFSSDWLLSQDPHAQFLISGLMVDFYCVSCMAMIVQNLITDTYCSLTQQQMDYPKVTVFMLLNSEHCCHKMETVDSIHNFSQKCSIQQHYQDGATMSSIKLNHKENTVTERIDIAHFPPFILPTMFLF